MKRILSTAAFIVLIVAIAAVAVYALNGQPAAETAAAPAAVPGSASVETNALAPAAAQNYNNIGMPLDSTAQMSSFDADGLATLVGPGVQQVFRLNGDQQIFESWYPPSSYGTNFDLEVGGSYWLLLDGTAESIVSLVGDVPEQNTIQFTLYGASPCKFNDITVPLDRSDITTADELATAIGGVEQVLQLDATYQVFQAWYPPTSYGTDFAVKIGYPYRVCLDATAPSVWP